MVVSVEHPTMNVLKFSQQALPGVYSAKTFVGWYNGLPSCRDVSSHVIVM